MALRGRQHAGGFAIGVDDWRRATKPPALCIRSSRAAKAAGASVRWSRKMARVRVAAGSLATTCISRAAMSALASSFPVRFGLLVVGIVDQRVGERHAIVGDIEPGGVDPIKRV